VDHQSGSRVCPKKKLRDRLIDLASRHPDWVLGFEDETWWSRFAQPHMHAWSLEGKTLRLIEQVPPAKDDTPKALACYGLLLRHCPQETGQWEEETWLRFIDGRPISAITTQFLEWCCGKLERMGKRVLILVWDNATWHISREVQNWIRVQNRRVKQTGQGVRIFVCSLPTKSPWLNPIEPKWMHGKRRIVEPERALSPLEVEHRVCAALSSSREVHLSVSENVS
jgi:hypothetical protein